MTTQVISQSFDFEARETFRVQILTLYFAAKQAAQEQSKPFDTGRRFDDIVVQVVGQDRRADMKAYIAWRRRKTKPTPYPYPEEGSVGMIRRLANCVELRLEQWRALDDGAPKTTRERDTRFFAAIGAVLKYERWRGCTREQARAAMLEELQRRAQQRRAWQRSVPRDANAPTVRTGIPDTPPSR